MKEVKILLVDDEPDILEFVNYNLRNEGYITETALNGLDAYDLVKSFKPDLILLDIMMPKMNGIELCEKLKNEGSLENTMVVFLTARSESFTQVSALESGGDDFIIKPIKPNILKSRIKAVLRRHPNFKLDGENTILKFDDLEINFEKYMVWIKGKETVLPKKEFELLKLLISKPGKVFERSVILHTIWGSTVIVGDRTIDVHIRKLREKIGDKYIKTLKGVGYKFEA